MSAANDRTKGAYRAVMMFAGCLLMVVGCRPMEPGIVPPTAQEFAELLEFTHPVPLIERVASGDGLAGLAENGVQPEVACSYSNGAQTCESYQFLLFLRGGFKGTERAEFDKMLTVGSEDPDFMGTTELPDGRWVSQFLVGFGPGGAAYGAIMPCADNVHEIVVIKGIETFDPGDPNQSVDEDDPLLLKYRTRATRPLNEVLPGLEALLFR